MLRTWLATPGYHTMKKFLPLVALALVLAGCATPEPAESKGPVAPAKMLVTASNFALAAPATATAGLTEVTIENAGTELHHVVFYRITDDHTVDDLRKELIDSNGVAPAWSVAHGGPNVAEPGKATKATIDLAPGRYALVCLIPSLDHIMHITKGMVTELTVTPATGEAATAPTPTARVTLDDFSFAIAPAITAGDHVIEVVNVGKNAHEVVVFELFGNATTMEFLQAIDDPNATAPPPGRAVGGVTPVSPGVTASVPLTFTPGRYTLVCFDTMGTDHGGPHFLEGMVYEFTVA